MLPMNVNCCVMLPCVDSDLCEGQFTSQRCSIFELDRNTGHITLAENVPQGRINGALELLVRQAQLHTSLHISVNMQTVYKFTVESLT